MGVGAPCQVFRDRAFVFLLVHAQAWVKDYISNAEFEMPWDTVCLGK